MLALIRNVLRPAGDESGQTLSEYALILVLIAVVAILGVTGFGAKVRDMFTTITASLIS